MKLTLLYLLRYYNVGITIYQICIVHLKQKYQIIYEYDSNQMKSNIGHRFGDLFLVILITKLEKSNFSKIFYNEIEGF